VLDTSGKETINEFIDHYTFINLKTREHYEYKSFYDTAITIRKFSHPDSIKLSGGFDFFALKNTTFSTGGMPKRVALDTTYTGDNGSSTIVKHIAYLRCDLKGLIVGLEKKLSQRIGCPVVRVDWVNLTNRGVIAAEIEIISNELSPQESKVFKAWEQNAQRDLKL
jgi:hypothetical protein